MSTTATSRQVLHQTLNFRVREIDREARRATFVAATEGGVRTWRGREHLRVAGMDLARFRKNPVFLDSHNWYDALAVVGRVVEIGVKDRELVAVVEFASTERALQIWSLVEGRFLNAVSVGFWPRKILEVAEGEVDGEGDAAIRGPADVITESELLELSVVSIPADEDALRQSAYRSLGLHRRTAMKRDASSTPAPAPEDEPAAGAPEDAQDAGAGGDAAGADAGASAQGAKPKIVHQAELAEAHRRRVHAITPRGLEAVADGCLLEGLSFEDTRQRLLDAHAKRSRPAGTPEPPAEGRGADEKPALTKEQLRATLFRA